MNLPQVVQYCFAGITVGSIYAIVAIGFNIIYNATGIINFAQGEFLIVGAMLAISFNHFVPLPVAIALAVVVTTIIGGLIEIVFIRQVRNASVLRLIVITIGISILMREAMLHIWDEKVRSLPYFTGTGISTVTILGAAYLAAGLVGTRRQRSYRNGAYAFFPIYADRPGDEGVRRRPYGGSSLRHQ